jgi:hypothetical protein
LPAIRNCWADIFRILAEDDGTETAKQNLLVVMASMHEFAAHPVIKSTKNLEKLLGEIQSLQRVLKITIDSQDGELKPLSFDREASADSAGRSRNLFEFTLR